MDHDPTSAASDFTCGSLTYVGHKGTNIALPSLAAQAAGVDVLAAVPGTVRGIRNDMADILQGTPGAPDVNDRTCGNGVVISHGDGWETQYCHMKQGSIIVDDGQRVAMGQVLGEVGLSGQTQFPHLHLSVRRDSQVVDPFVPDGQITCGETADEALWSMPAPFPSGGLITARFSDAVPDYAVIKAGDAAKDTLQANGPALVV